MRKIKQNKLTILDLSPMRETSSSAIAERPRCRVG